MNARSLARTYAKRFDVPALLVAAAVALALGLHLPLIRVEKAIVISNDYSVWTGITGLAEDGEWFLAGVLFFFSFVFPIGKLLLLAWIWFFERDGERRARRLHWLEELGRWSMLDVFVVAILIVATKLGPLAEVQARDGVYWFGSAILLSMITTIRVRKLALAA